MYTDQELNNEATALKVLIHLIDKYMSNDQAKLEAIRVVSGLPGCLPGRAVGSFFSDVKLNEEEVDIIQRIINFYG